jgi:hypothetical protein
MSMTIRSDNSGANFSAYPSPLRTPQTASAPSGAGKGANGDGRKTAVTEIINPARASIAALLGETNLDHSATPERAMSVQAARAAFSAF